MNTNSSFIHLHVGVALTMILALPGQILAQPPSTGSIVGCVSEKDGRLAGVEIALVGSGTHRRAMTDVAGCYEIEELPPGTYNLTARITPWLPESRDSIPLRAGDRLRFDLVMTLAPGAIREPPLQGISAMGKIAGCAMDGGGGALPGVAIRVAAQMTCRESVTNSRGCYEITRLPPGNYTLTAELAGFRTQRHDGVIVEKGRDVNVGITLPVAPATDVVWLKLPITVAEAARQADTVVYLRIDRSLGAKSWKALRTDVIGTYEVTGREYLSTVLSVAKADQFHARNGTTLRFIQVARPQSEPPYREREEFVAFLNWDQNIGAYQRLAGSNWVVPVRDVRIASDDRTFLACQNGARVEDFLAEIEKLK